MQRIDSKGFTMTETIISLLTVMVVITLSFPLLKSLKSPNYYQELSARQLFTFIQEEVNESTNVTFAPSKLTITDNLERSILIEHYNTIIRRRVNGTGHEVLLNGVVSFHIEDKTSYFIVSVEMEGGATYQKNIQYFID